MRYPHQNLSLFWSALALALTMPFSAFSQSMQQAKPWMGIGIEKGSKGVLIKNVLKETPAERAGFQVGDEIVTVDGKDIKEPGKLIEAVQSKGVGYSLDVGFWRKDKKLKKTLKLELQPDAMDMMDKLYVGKKSPDFEIFDYKDGKSLKADALDGQVVLLEFWATWCPACRASQPLLTQIARSRKDLRLVSVTDEDEMTVQAFMKGKDFGYPVYIDKGQKATAAYQVASIPCFFLIDREGIVRRVVMGGGSYLEALIPEIDALLKTPAKK